MYLFHADIFLSSPSPFLSFLIFWGVLVCGGWERGYNLCVFNINLFRFAYLLFSVRSCTFYQVYGPLYNPNLLSFSVCSYSFICFHLLAVFGVLMYFCKVHGPLYNPKLLSFSVCTYSFTCFHLLAVFGVLMYFCKVHGPRYNPNLLSFSVCS